jgi:hypothetical protein
VTEVDEFYHFYVFHRKDAEGAERKFFYKKPLRTLRLCGELKLQSLLRALYSLQQKGG